MIALTSCAHDGHIRFALVFRAAKKVGHMALRREQGWSFSVVFAVRWLWHTIWKPVQRWSNSRPRMYEISRTVRFAPDRETSAFLCNFGRLILREFCITCKVFICAVCAVCYGSCTHRQTQGDFFCRPHFLTRDGCRAVCIYNLTMLISKVFEELSSLPGSTRVRIFLSIQVIFIIRKHDIGKYLVRWFVQRDLRKLFMKNHKVATNNLYMLKYKNSK